MLFSFSCVAILPHFITVFLNILSSKVALFSGVLTAFIIQISDRLQPAPGDVTNKILIAIYNRTMDATAPIDLEQFLRLDEGIECLPKLVAVHKLDNFYPGGSPSDGCKIVGC